MRIPYGVSNFAQLREKGCFYVDKTPFIPMLESIEAGFNYLIFLRPRRFGKSLLVSMLEHYYDIARADEFDTLFQGLAIHANPTPERNAYLVLTLDFSEVDTSGGPEVLRETFFHSVRSKVVDFLLWYRPRVPEFGPLLDTLDDYRQPEALLGAVFGRLRSSGERLYILIDEYDSFANALLASGQVGVYGSMLATETSFVKSFFQTLKGGTRSGAVARMFVTGVSPLMLDDLASGFNIVKLISPYPRFNTLAGFTWEDVSRAVDEFLEAHPQYASLPEVQDRDVLMGILETYYDGYRFSSDARERVYNSDMVLYFLSEMENRERFPPNMLDVNVRTDYGKLLALASGLGTGETFHREVLEKVLSGEDLSGELTDQFGVISLSGREEFISLLYYMGLLTRSGEQKDPIDVRLEIPNRVIRGLHWEHMAHILRAESGSFDVRGLKQATKSMASGGDPLPFLELFHARVVKALGLKDLRQFDEKAMKLMLLAFLSLNRTFSILSEKEFAQGYADLFLGVNPLWPSAEYGWLLEVKYVKKGGKKADRAREVARKRREAEEQLERYLSDGNLVEMLKQGKRLKAGTIVFEGTESYHWHPYPCP